MSVCKQTCACECAALNIETSLPSQSCQHTCDTIAYNSNTQTCAHADQILHSWTYVICAKLVSQ